MVAMLSGGALAYFLFRDVGKEKVFGLGARISGTICAIATVLLVIIVCLSLMFGSGLAPRAPDEFCRTESYMVGKTIMTRSVCITPVPVSPPIDKP